MVKKIALKLCPHVICKDVNPYTSDLLGHSKAGWVLLILFDLISQRPVVHLKAAQVGIYLGSMLFFMNDFRLMEIVKTVAITDDQNITGCDCSSAFLNNVRSWVQILLGATLHLLSFLTFHEVSKIRHL